MSYAKRVWFAAVLVGVATCSAEAGLLGTSTNYNVFTFGNYTQQNVDVTGRLAVQGNLTVSGFGVGSALSTAGGDTLVVGGNMSYQNGQVYKGDARVGGTAGVSGFGIPDGKLYYNAAGNPAPPNWVPQQQVAGGGIASTFFSTAATYANALSTGLASMATNGSISINNMGKITLETTQSGLTVFNLTAAQFAGASGQGIEIKSSKGATVVVNIKGTGTTAVTASNLGFNLSGGIDQSKVVYNFTGVSTISTTNLGYKGSILAPQAVFNGTFGSVDGDVVVASVTGTTEFHNAEFTGSLSGVPLGITAVPEPSTFAGAGVGVFVLALAARRRRA